MSLEHPSSQDHAAPTPAAAESPRLRLSVRQAQCLAGVARGLISKEIAREIGLSHRTVDRHIAEAMARLNTRTRSAAVICALSSGELRLDGLATPQRATASGSQPAFAAG